MVEHSDTKLSTMIKRTPSRIYYKTKNILQIPITISRIIGNKKMAKIEEKNDNNQDFFNT